MERTNLIAQLMVDIPKMNVYELRNMITYSKDILENAKIVKARRRREELINNPNYDKPGKRCDCCIELWKNCSCWCSNCNVEYKLCRASCYKA